MNKYKQSIIIFGYVIPAVLLIGVLITCQVISGGYVKKAAERETAFMMHNNLQNKVTSLQAGVKNRREAIDSWDKVVQPDIRPLFQVTMKDILEKYSSKQVAQTSFYKPNTVGSIAKGAAQKSASISLEFRGSYLPMETALLELESRLPQLQLNSMIVSTERGNNELKFDLNYSAWEKAD